jgi:SAM-dependent methyltransferase
LKKLKNKKVEEKDDRKKSMHKSTTWEGSHKWYGRIVGESGHFYHQNIIFPHLLKLLKLKKEKTSILDLGCGQGILSRIVSKEFYYSGIDISPSLIKEARKLSDKKNDIFLVGDITKDRSLIKDKFDYVCFILSIQNINDPKAAINFAAASLKPEGRLIIIMNHPCFRIPRQSSWGIDEAKKMQFRRIDNYMSHLEIPLQTHPSKENKSQLLYSYHFPLSAYCNWLYESNLLIENIYELCSSKKSIGPKAKMEDRAREEIPLFMSLIGKKL